MKREIFINNCLLDPKPSKVCTKILSFRFVSQLLKEIKQSSHTKLFGLVQHLLYIMTFVTGTSTARNGPFYILQVFSYLPWSSTFYPQIIPTSPSFFWLPLPSLMTFETQNNPPFFWLPLFTFFYWIKCSKFTKYIGTISVAALSSDKWWTCPSYLSHITMHHRYYLAFQW